MPSDVRWSAVGNRRLLPQQPAGHGRLPCGGLLRVADVGRRRAAGPRPELLRARGDRVQAALWLSIDGAALRVPVVRRLGRRGRPLLAAACVRGDALPGLRQAGRRGGGRHAQHHVVLRARGRAQPRRAGPARSPAAHAGGAWRGGRPSCRSGSSCLAGRHGGCGGTSQLLRHALLGWSSRFTPEPTAKPVPVPTAVPTAKPGARGRAPKRTKTPSPRPATLDVRTPFTPSTRTPTQGPGPGVPGHGLHAVHR